MIPEKLGAETMKNVRFMALRIAIHRVQVNIVAIGSEKLGFDEFIEEGITKFVRTVLYFFFLRCGELTKASSRKYTLTRHNPSTRLFLRS